jgi:hypothetical protein
MGKIHKTTRNNDCRQLGEPHREAGFFNIESRSILEEQEEREG